MTNADFHIRPELDRVRLAARLCSRPDELKEAVEALALCVKGLMQSFGIDDVRVRPSRVEGLDGQVAGYVFEQLDREGRTIKRATVIAPSIEVPDPSSN